MAIRSSSSSRRARRSQQSSASTDRNAVLSDPPCPFCEIARLNPSRVKIAPYDTPSTPISVSRRGLTKTHMILSTPQVVGFLDIMPLSPGHVLLTPRHHAEKIMDLTPEEGASLGAWLPIVTRAVSRAMQVEDINVVQNNGMDSECPENCHVKSDYMGKGGEGIGGSVAEWKRVFGEVKGRVGEVFSPGSRASQTVKHVHYHIIPRPETYTPSRSWTMFGKGVRDDIDDDEGSLIAAKIRQEIAWEMERLGQSQDSAVFRTKFLTPEIAKL